jgi:cytidylate kinase
MASEIELRIERLLNSWQLESRMRRQAARKQPVRPVPLRPYVALSRSFGSGGGAIVRRLSEKLGYQVFDREILEAVVNVGRFRAEILESLDDRDRSQYEIWVDSLLRGPLANRGEYLRTLVGVLVSVAMHGHVVIIGAGGNLILDPGRGLHVRVVAPAVQRSETIGRLRAIPHDEAQRLLQETDARRIAFIREHFEADLDDPLAYDLVLNTAGIGVEAAVSLIERALRLKLANNPHVQF